LTLRGGPALSGVPAKSFYKWRRVFDSGGAGFIGSHLVRSLLDGCETERVIIFDNFTSGQRSYIEAVVKDSRVHVVGADLKKSDAVSDAIAGCDTVFNLAANPDIAKTVSQPDIVRFDCSKIKGHGWKVRRTSAEAITSAMEAMLEELRHA
jgi:nucleoside-diphosphate-sugar epimerase